MRPRLSHPLERAVCADALEEEGRRLRLPERCYSAADAAADDDDADDDADDAADAADRKPKAKLTLNGANMVSGLVVVQVPGRSGWRVTLVAWAREVRPDEWEMCGARVISRTSYSVRGGLAALAQKGPTTGYALADACTEYAHRFDLTRCRRADEAAWAKHCPKPEGWTP